MRAALRLYLRLDDDDQPLSPTTPLLEVDGDPSRRRGKAAEPPTP